MRRPPAPPILWTMVLAALAIAAVLSRPVVRAAGSALTADMRYLLDPEGRVVGWDPATDRLAPLEIPGGGAVKDLAVVAPEELLALVDQGAAADRHRRAQGTALLLAPSPTGLREVGEVHFHGRGFKVVVGRDGERAYVVSYRIEASGGATQQRAWVHALDLRSGKVADSAALPDLPEGVALDPHGDRLYFSLRDRILTYTTAPLASSWRYRSPGINRGLAFLPASAILLAVRPRAVAVFDPRVIAARTAEDRRARNDDATALIPLSIEAADLLCPGRDAPVIAYGEGGLLAFLDAGGARVIDGPPPDSVMIEARQVRPLLTGPEQGAVRFAVFPPGTIVRVPLPGLPPSSMPAAEPSPSAPPPAPA
ncbi:MAG TPA: hypothetical protein VNL37_03605, partial [Candidatus Polarisedimenticolia bacterium]|nr:hypothetical protein [Candidatus Polarisedimenticolia bacterium]